ncbi:MAG TPA: hypothetical protein VK059_07730 [Nocardioidaceae bacterium]|nr:hypothetical protein [Nocardioidaceae bacterium]
MMQPDQPPVDPSEQIRRLGARVEAIERARRREAKYRGFGPAYAACASALIIIMFLPIYDDVAEKGRHASWSFEYGSIWDMITRDNASPISLIALLMVAGLVALLTAASFTRTIEPYGKLISITVLSAALAIMIMAKPATPRIQPDVAEGGLAGFVLLLAITALASAHTIMLEVDRRAWLASRSRRR